MKTQHSNFFQMPLIIKKYERAILKLIKLVFCKIINIKGIKYRWQKSVEKTVNITL